MEAPTLVLYDQLLCVYPIVAAVGMPMDNIACVRSSVWTNSQEITVPIFFSWTGRQRI